MACLDPWGVPTYSYGAAGQSRGTFVLQSLFPTKDGMVRIISNLPRHWAALRSLLGDPATLAEERLQDPAYRREHGPEVHDLISEHTRGWTSQDIFDAGQAAGLIVTPLQPPSGYMNDPNEIARGFWREVDHPVVGKARYAGMAATYRDIRQEITRPAPRLGEHNTEVYGQLGLSEADIERLRIAGTI